MARVTSVIDQDAETLPRYSDGFAIEEE